MMMTMTMVMMSVNVGLQTQNARDDRKLGTITLPCGLKVPMTTIVTD